ncbi:MAG: hypothetical protein U1E93_00370 [Alphaproteobacteria bacterium]
MQNYRVYLVGEDGHIQKAHDIACATDLAALEQAGRDWPGQTVEVWQGARRVQPPTGRLDTAS